MINHKWWKLHCSVTMNIRTYITIVIVCSSRQIPDANETEMQVKNSELLKHTTRYPITVFIAKKKFDRKTNTDVVPKSPFSLFSPTKLNSWTSSKKFLLKPERQQRCWYWDNAVDKSPKPRTSLGCIDNLTLIVYLKPPLLEQIKSIKQKSKPSHTRTVMTCIVQKICIQIPNLVKPEHIWRVPFRISAFFGSDS